MLLLNELRYLLRQPLSWLALVLLPVFSVLLAVGSGGDNIDTAKQLLYLHCALIMLALPILVGAIAPVVLNRDQNHGMTELVEVTPIARARRYLARYAAIVIFSGVVTLLCMVIISVIIWQQTGASSFAATALHALLLLLPTVLLFAAISWCLSSYRFGATTIYLVFAAIWLGYTTLAAMSGSPILAGSKVLSQSLLTTMIWFDPFGFTAYLQPTLAGNPALLDVPTLTNRILMLGVSALLIRVAWRNRSFALANGDKAGKANPQHEATNHSPATQFLAVRAAPKPLVTLLVLARSATARVLCNKLNLIILAIWSAVVFSEVASGINYAEPLSSLSGNSHDALNRVIWGILAELGAVLVLFWSSQVAWLNKRTRIEEIIAATPISSLSIMLSQMIAVLCMIVLLCTVTALATLAAEVVVHSTVMLSAYLVYFGLSFLPLTLLATLFLVIHTVCRRQLTAVAACLAILVLKFTSFTALIGIPHPLWNIAGSPLTASDQQWGFAGSLSSYMPFMLFWALVIGIVLVYAVWVSHRASGLATPKPRSCRALALGSAVTLCLLFTLAHFRLQSENPFIGLDTSADWRGSYEHQYGDWQQVPQPVATAIDSQVAFFPSQGYADISITMTLTNPHQQSISSVLVGGYATQTYDTLALTGAKMKHYDPALNQSVFTFAKPLAPQQSTQLKVSFRYQQPSLFAAAMQQVVKPQFSYLRGSPLVPTVGFYTEFRLRDLKQRAGYDLPHLDLTEPSKRFATTSANGGRYDWVNMHTLVSTEVSQYGLAQGNLVKQWTDDHRAYFEYQTAGPIRNLPAWLSLPEQPSEEKLQDITLKVFSPEQQHSDQFHLTAMRKTVQWFIDQGIAAPFNNLSLVSTPDIGVTGYALPQLVLLNHKVGFRAYPAKDATYDQRFRRTVHETAHQWFGHGLGNGVEYDRAFMIESMAKYIELVLLDKYYGESAMQGLVDYEAERFRLQRASSQSAPLSLVDGRHSFEMYSAATVVFAKLRRVVGDQPIVNAIRELWNNHRYPQQPATSMDFVRALKKQLDSKLHNSIDELFLSPLTIKRVAELTDG